MTPKAVSEMVQRLREAANAESKYYDSERGLLREAASMIEELAKDAERLGWLEQQWVEVRTPARYGSRPNFLASPSEDNDPSDIRAKISAAMQKPQS